MTAARIYRIGELTKDHPQWIGKIRVTHVEGVTVPGECWLWQGATGTGYGRVTVNKKGYILHRYAYTHIVGPIPAGLHIDHLCRQPTCCAPHHLEPVTCLTNVRRGIRATKTKCPRGHEYAGDNLYVYRSKRGTHRTCRTCRTEYMREYHAQRKAQREATWAKYLSEQVSS